MPELRQDPIVNRWVIIAPDRAKRPIELAEAVEPTSSAFDPFAEGNEASTPPETLAFRNPGSAANGPGWRVRVVRNKFPALKLLNELDPQSNGLHERMNGLGIHEVIIECPHDEANLSRLSAENIREVLTAFQSRMIDLKEDHRLVHVTIFKNKGVHAGASLSHSHSQLMATPVVPMAIQEQMNGALEFFQKNGKSVFQELVLQEIATGSRMVLDATGFVAFCPYASRFPYETWILPKQQNSHFEQTSLHELEELGQVLKTVLQKLEWALDDPPYNFVIHTAPLHETFLPHFRWHLEILPRLTRIAGFELGSGFYINPVPPEEAALTLRNTVSQAEREHG